MNLLHLNPADLRPHPDTACLHSLADADPRFTRLVDGMLAHGFAESEPLKVDPAHRVVDGRHRCRAAKLAGLTTVPCVVVPEEQVATLIIQSIVSRKHFTKSALAFEVYPLLKKAHAEAVDRHIARLKTGNQGTISASGGYGQTPAEIALRIGISRDTFDRAREVHRIFEQDPEYAALMLPRLFGEMVGGEHEDHRPVGLGAVLAGWAGRSQHTQAQSAKARAEGSRQLRLFGENFKPDRWDYWQNFDDTEKRIARQRLATSCEAMPDDLLAALKDAIKAEEKRRAHEEPK